MPKQREEVLNGELGRLLIQRHPSWHESNVHIDSTRTIRENPALKIDVLVENPGGQPIAIETKFDGPNISSALKTQVEDRINLTVDPTGDVIESGISVVYPVGLKSSQLESEPSLRYAVHQLGEDDLPFRWPEQDEWIIGNVDDLTDAVEVVSLSEKRIRQGEKFLAEGIKDASSRLEKGPVDHYDFHLDLANVLHQEEGQQTTRMAVAIVFNAFVFHYSIEGLKGIPDVSTGTSNDKFQKDRVLRVWEKVLAVNYWPIFSIAYEILKCVPTNRANELLNNANEVSASLLEIGATTFHDLAARMFQTLIADRKFLATFYTLPESACFLAELAVSMMDVDWDKKDEVENLKVADFACGTGTLLSATQQAIFRRLRRSGFNDRDSHKISMENVLLGTDIMPSAVHLAASILSSAHPGVGYESSLIRVLPYGIDEELSKLSGKKVDTAYLGSLDLRMAEDVGQSLYTGSGTGIIVGVGGQQIGSKGIQDQDDGATFPVQHESFDLVIMNPPFTRPTNHEGRNAEVPIPSFAGFGTSEDEQSAMSKKLGALKKQFGHGNAGLASEFMDLAHDKLKPGGVLAIVLPFAFVSGKSWSKARDSLSRFYSDIHVIAIATSGSTFRAFSADTGMAECLVLARKENVPHKNPESVDVRYVNLKRRPRTLVEAHQEAKRIRDGLGTIGTNQDGGLAGLSDQDIGRLMIQIRQCKIVLPRTPGHAVIPITTMNEIVDRGLLSRDINGPGQRGAFDLVKTEGDGIHSYPALWNHHANKERSLIVEPDSYCIPRNGMEEKAKMTWQSTASRLHYNVDFQLNSQSLAVCTTREDCIGGTAWPNILPHDASYDVPILLWSNTTLGLMLFWWFGSRQQQGRARLKITVWPDLLTLDVRELTIKQLQNFNDLFDEFKDLHFLPANEAYRDITRHRLDAKVLSILGLSKRRIDAFDLIRMKWCAEPSVHGGKSTRPQHT